MHYNNDSVPSHILKPGLTVTIEPMINAGKGHIKLLADEWAGD